MARHAALETFGRSGNPVFGDKFNQSQGFVGSERMTLDGTVNKTGISFRLLSFALERLSAGIFLIQRIDGSRCFNWIWIWQLPHLYQEMLELLLQYMLF